MLIFIVNIKASLLLWLQTMSMAYSLTISVSSIACTFNIRKKKTRTGLSTLSYFQLNLHGFLLYYYRQCLFYFEVLLQPFHSHLHENRIKTEVRKTALLIITYFYVHGSVHRESMSITVQQNATIYSFIIFLQTDLHVSDDTLIHHQEHTQTVITTSGTGRTIFATVR